jgi:cell division protein FtsB
MFARLGKLLAALKPTNLLAGLLVALLGYGAWVAYGYHRRSVDAQLARQQLEDAVGQLQKRNTELKESVASLEAQRAELQRFVERLTAESRVAEVKVLGQRRDAEAGVVLTTFEFVETGRAGQAPPRVFTLRGDIVYFEALVIRFLDKEVMVGDPLRGKSLHLFRRAFGDAQQPREGPPLAASHEDGIPDVYRVSPSPSAFERRLWRLFWHWADHPAEAEKEGVAVASIKAEGFRPAPGATYQITLRHAGGLEIKRTDVTP